MQTELRLLSVAMVLSVGVAAGQGPSRVHYSLSPEMRIDGDPADLSAVTFVLPTRTGGVVLGQLQDRMLRYFDANGRPMGTFGRSGEGPGEFRQMVTGGLKADTVWVFDLTLLRLTPVTPDRKLLRTARASSGSGFPPYVRAVFGPDSLVLWGHGTPRNGRFERAYIRGKAEPVGIFPPSLPTSNLPVIADFPPFGCSARSGAAGIAIPYCHRPTEAASGDGGRVAVLTKPDGADSQDYHLTVLSRAGDTLISRNYHPTRFPMRPAVYRKAVDELLAQVRGNAADVAGLREKMPAPAFYPPATFALFDDSGRLWIGQRIENGQYWEILDREGRVLGDVRVPTGVRIEAVTANKVWAVEATSEGIESVIRYRLQSR